MELFDFIHNSHTENQEINISIVHNVTSGK